MERWKRREISATISVEVVECVVLVLAPRYCWQKSIVIGNGECLVVHFDWSRGS